MAQKRRGKMTRKQRQRQLHRRMFLTGVLVVLICVGIYSGIRRVEAEKGGRYRYSLHRKPGKHGDAEP